MKKTILLSSLILSSVALAKSNNAFYQETVKCGNEGCEIVCHEPGARWDTFLRSKGDLEITYFFTSGTRQIKADVGNGEYTILDTNPSFQSCRISGVVK